MVTAFLGCATPSAPDPQVLIYARNASYSIAPAAQATISAELVFLNTSDRLAKLGCGLSLERDTGSGFEVVDRAACSSVGGLAESIFPNKEVTLPVVRDYPSTLIDENSKYRFVMSLAFAPEFNRTLGFRTEPFVLSKK